MQTRKSERKLVRNQSQRRQAIPTGGVLHRVLVEEMGIHYVDEIDQAVLNQLRSVSGIGPKKIEVVQGWLPATETVARPAEVNDLPAESQSYYPAILLPVIVKHLNLTVDQAVGLAELTSQDSIAQKLRETTLKADLRKKLIWAWEREVKQYQAWKLRHANQTLNLKALASDLRILRLQINPKVIGRINPDAKRGWDEVSNELCYRLTTYSEHFTSFELAFSKDVERKKHWADIQQLDQYLNQPTLNDIGQRLGLTRERVRQLKAQMKACRDFWSEVFQIQETIALQYLATRSVVSLTTLPLATQQWLARLTTPKLTVGRLPVLVNPALTEEQVRQLERLDSRLQQSSNEFYLEQLAELVRMATDSSKEKSDLISAIQERYGYHYALGNYLYKKPLSDKDYFLKLATEQPKRIFACDDAGIQHLKQLFIQKFQRPLFRHPVKNEQRALAGKLGRLVDLNKFTYLGNNQFRLADHQKLTEAVCRQIETSLQTRLTQVSEVSASSLYHQFENEMRRAGIENRYEFYYELRYFFKNEFDFGHKNTMNIRKAGEKLISVQEHLRQYLEKNQGYAQVDEVCQAFGWPDYTLNQTVISCPEMNIHDNWVLLQNFELPEPLQNQLRSLMTRQMAQHPDYLLMNELRKQVVNDPEWRSQLQQVVSKLPFAQKYLIKTAYFADIITALDPDLRGHAFVKYRTEAFDDGQLILDHFHQLVLSRQAISTFYHELGYQDSSIYVIIRRLQERQKLVAVGTNKFVIGQSLNQLVDDSEIKEKVNRYLGKRLAFADDNAYISLKGQGVMANELPELLHLEWTPELVGYVATRGAYYRQLDWQGENGTTRPTNPVIMVRQTSPIKSITSLVRYLMTLYRGEWTVKAVIDYLQQRQILLNLKTDKLPEILMTVLAVDSYQSVHLK